MTRRQALLFDLAQLVGAIGDELVYRGEKVQRWSDGLARRQLNSGASS